MPTTKLRQNFDTVVLPRSDAAIDNGHLTRLSDLAAAIGRTVAWPGGRRSSAGPDDCLQRQISSARDVTARLYETGG